MIHQRIFVSGIILTVAAMLAGCNSMRATPVAVSAPPPGFATQAYTPSGFQLPSGTGCSADVARWKAIQDNDYASGNVNLKVYSQIKGEISNAASVCAAGRDAEASALIATSRRRHGYPD